MHVRALTLFRWKRKNVFFFLFKKLYGVTAAVAFMMCSEEINCGSPPIHIYRYPFYFLLLFSTSFNV